MQSTERETSAKWESVIAELTVKDATSQTEIRELIQQRDALALDSALGVNGAPQNCRG